MVARTATLPSERSRLLGVLEWRCRWILIQYLFDIPYDPRPDDDWDSDCHGFDYADD